MVINCTKKEERIQLCLDGLVERVVNSLKTGRGWHVWLGANGFFSARREQNVPGQTPHSNSNANFYNQTIIGQRSKNTREQNHGQKQSNQDPDSPRERVLIIYPTWLRQKGK